MRRSYFHVLVFLVIILHPWHVWSDTIHVPGDFPTIQEAVVACHAL